MRLCQHNIFQPPLLRYVNNLRYKILECVTDVMHDRLRITARETEYRWDKFSQLQLSTVSHIQMLLYLLKV